MSKERTKFRVKITTRGSSTYICRAENGKVWYMSGSQTPLALSNLVSNQAAELQFRLEDVVKPADAFKIVRECLKALWANNPNGCPVVELLP